jgi:hypothetical protein
MLARRFTRLGENRPWIRCGDGICTVGDSDMIAATHCRRVAQSLRRGGRRGGGSLRRVTSEKRDRPERRIDTLKTGKVLFPRADTLRGS